MRERPRTAPLFEIRRERRSDLIKYCKGGEMRARKPKRAKFKRHHRRASARGGARKRSNARLASADGRPLGFAGNGNYNLEASSTLT